MTLIIPDGFAQTSIVWSSSTFHKGRAYTVQGWGLGDNTLADLADAVAEAVTTNMIPQLSTEISVPEVIAVTQTGRESTPVALTGTRAGEIVPPNVTTLVSYGTGIRGAANRGRSYLPGFLKDDDVGDGGNITDDRLADLLTMMDAYGSHIAGLGFEQVILHANNDAPTAVTGGVVEQKIATQRRRLR